MATNGDRRRELRTEYERQRPEAGVYAIRNATTGRVLIGSTLDLRSARNRLEFGRATGSIGALDGRLAADARAHGVASFEFETLDVLDDRPEASPDSVAADLRALEALWQERLADTPQY